MHKNKRVLVTGGLGYVGSHTVVALLEAGYDVTIVDNCSNSFPDVFERIQKISQGSVEFINADVSSRNERMATLFAQKFVGAIHFAAYVSVPESVSMPEKYYANNLGALTAVLHLSIRNDRQMPLVFSSSAAVYGNNSLTLLSEDTPFASPPSPYAATKQRGEEMIRNHISRHQGRAIALRYFNPVGAHPSALLGEQYRIPTFHLVPALCEVAIGLRKTFVIFGNDYPTPDGTCIRDYVHVMDVARAHVAALERLESGSDDGFEIFNIGSGSGFSVRTMVEEFQKVNDVTVSFEYADRRPGDPAYLVANVKKAREILRWEPLLSLAEMLTSAWRWERQKIELEQNGAVSVSG